MMLVIKKAFALSLFLSLIAASTQAEIYKWTDAEGKVHYSATPPAGGEKANKAKEISNDIALSTGKRIKAESASDDTASNDTNKTGMAGKAGKEGSQTASDEKFKQSRHQHRAFCKQQKNALKTLKENSLVRWKDSETGANRLLTNKERKKKIQKFQKSLETACNENMLPNQKSN